MRILALKRHDEEDRTTEDNTWTSNSDLFMAIAVVFLIMFVFSLLTTGVKNTQTFMEKKADKEYRLAKIPEAVKDQNQRDIASFEKSIQTIQEKNKKIQDSMSQMTSLANAIESQRKAFVRTKDDLLAKTTMMNDANEKIKKQQREIEELVETTKQQKQNLSKAHTQESNLKKELDKSKSKIEQTKEKISKMQRSKAEMAAQLKYENTKVNTSFVNTGLTMRAWPADRSTTAPLPM